MFLDGDLGDLYLFLKFVGLPELDVRGVHELVTCWDARCLQILKHPNSPETKTDEFDTGSNM